MVTYGLIGKKLVHSFSADFFNHKFQKEGLSDEYQLLPISSIELFPSLLIKYPHLKGINVTIPYKQEIIPFLTDLSEEARAIGAVNVIKILKEGNELFLKGYNSDVIGFKNSLLPLLRPDIKKALVLGTGGASKAVFYVLKNLGIKVTFVSRKKSDNAISYEDINEELMNENLLIVNTTPLGMFPESDKFPPIPYQFISPNHVLYDLIYNPQETVFMKKGRDQGAIVKNGLEMLELQAIGSWDIWNK